MAEKVYEVFGLMKKGKTEKNLRGCFKITFFNLFSGATEPTILSMD